MLLKVSADRLNNVVITSICFNNTHWNVIRYVWLTLYWTRLGHRLSIQFSISFFIGYFFPLCYSFFYFFFLTILLSRLVKLISSELNLLLISYQVSPPYFWDYHTIFYTFPLNISNDLIILTDFIRYRVIWSWQKNRPKSSDWSRWDDLNEKPLIMVQHDYTFKK